MATPHTLTLDRRDHVFRIGLNRPDKMNAFTLQMLSELSAAYRTFQDDSELWCAVLYGHGDHFTAGLDLAEVGPAVAGGAPLFPEGGLDPLDLLSPRRTKPVVCAVQGWCITIGIELLLACDIRVCAEDTRFRQMEVNRGIMPFGGATLRLPQVAGWGNAMRWLLTGDVFDADEARRIGLIQEVAPVGAQVERADAIADRVAACAPLAVSATRTSSRVAVEQGNDAATAVLLAEARKLMTSDDAAEGVRSFLERRPARFTGK
jgi:enoyl-CoA hydratase/carnithine racemase